MEAARQKEMNVSITEDATMRRTRSEGGATVVRVDAIVCVPAKFGGYISPESLFVRGPSVSVCLNEGGVNRKA